MPDHWLIRLGITKAGYKETSSGGWGAGPGVSRCFLKTFEALM